MTEEADVRHPGDIGGGAGAGDEGRKGADVEDEVWYGVGFFDFILLAGGKVQAPCPLFSVMISSSIRRVISPVPRQAQFSKTRSTLTTRSMPFGNTEQNVRVFSPMSCSKCISDGTVKRSFS